jgi:hypothetical protein
MYQEDLHLLYLHHKVTEMKAKKLDIQKVPSVSLYNLFIFILVISGSIRTSACQFCS